MSLLDDFFMRAVLAGVGAALAAAPLGCFVIWRRMAYFGDSTAHAAVLGVALSLIFELPLMLAVFAVALTSAILVVSYTRRGTTGADTLLGVIAHGGLAFGLVAVSLVPGVRVDLEGLLFGDILAVSRLDVVTVWFGGALVLGLILWRWSAWLAATLNEDLAQAAGLNPHREHLWQTLALAAVVALALKIVGALLITALLIIPAAAARPFARSPEAMAGLAMIMGAGSVIGGLNLAWVLDTPAGPTVVSTATAIFVVSASLGRL